jgi:translation initiation factor 2 subunit 3
MPAKKKPAEKKAGKPLPEVNIGLVGHVDHGKTTLTQALTGRWTDTHSEEIKRGITIRLGYADVTFYRCPKCKGTEAYGNTGKCIKCFSEAEPIRTVSFVDAPGHETLMSTVLSGAALMDGAILVVSANEQCPQPQTKEHLLALNITGIKNIVIVQNKIDLVDEEGAKKSYRQIKDFLKGTVAENAPIIPISAQKNINIDALIEAIEEHIRTPKRDPSKPPKLVVARSFDVNKPGTSIPKIRGGVIGGTLLQGELKVGDDVEIKPGIKMKSGYEPVRTRITGLQKAMTDLDSVGPGGLLGVSTELDPAIAKSDRLGGNIMGHPGKLPPVMPDVSMKTHIMERVVGAKEELKVEPVKNGEPLMLTIGVVRTVGVVTAPSPAKTVVQLKMPICADKGDRVAISRQVGGRWRLIGWAQIL